jgi:hypothetical protein
LAAEVNARACGGAKIEVKQVRATMTRDEMEPQWEVVVSYGPHAADVVIALPGRQLATDDLAQSHRESVEAMESLATALLEFSDHIRKQFPSHFD